ncbi:MAG: UDP-N-acetylmuramyl peptide synthase, partial [Parcubacteria group bacterium]|nr:UDP-N-acetylmuramyl peptide synthase [Parcubacteria group bacterium]
MKEIIKKVVPKWAISFYHWVLANFGALIYGYPSKKLIVIGVTGTKGKSTSSYLIAKFLEGAGHKVGLTSTIIFKVGEKEWLNDKKMTMLGRFGLQKLLKEMVKECCKYAVIETSSEGIA